MNNTTTQRRSGVNEREIRVRHTVDGEGRVESDQSVFCQYRLESIPLKECVECPYFDEMTFKGVGEPSAVYCNRVHTAPGMAGSSELPRDPWQAWVAVRDMPSTAARTEVRDVMSHDVVCVKAEVSVEDAEQILLDKEVSGIPVVDDDGHPVGMVTQTDLVRVHHESEGLEEVVEEAADNEPTEQRVRQELGIGYHVARVAHSLVREVMTPIAVTLAEDAPLSQAAALMAQEELHRLPIVSKTGQVVGVLSTMDVLRWLGRNDGYIISPHRPHPPA